MRVKYKLCMMMSRRLDGTAPQYMMVHSRFPFFWIRKKSRWFPAQFENFPVAFGHSTSEVTTLWRYTNLFIIIITIIIVCQKKSNTFGQQRLPKITKCNHCQWTRKIYMVLVVQNNLKIGVILSFPRACNKIIIPYSLTLNFILYSLIKQINFYAPHPLQC